MTLELDMERGAPATGSYEVGLDEIRRGPTEIDLRELLRRVWSRRRLVLSLAAAAASAIAIFSWTRPDTYRAEALLMPAAKASSALDGVAGGVFGLARVARFELADGDARTALALETLKSRAFSIQFVREHDLSVPLLAAQSWDRTSDRITIDPDLYDVQAERWVRRARRGRSPDPTNTEIYEAFARRVTVTESKRTGFVKVSVDFLAPTTAKRWLDLIIADLNRAVRDQEARDARTNIAYLERQIAQTGLAEVRAVLYQLLAAQQKELMLAQAREEFAFKVIDPPAVADEKHGPRRLTLTAVGGTAGLALGAFIAIWVPGAPGPSTRISRGGASPREDLSQKLEHRIA